MPFFLHGLESIGEDEDAVREILGRRSDCRGRFALALARRLAVAINSAVTLACYLLLLIEVMADMRESCLPDPCKLLPDRRHKAKGCFRSDRLIKGLVAHIDQENRIAVTILAGSNVNSGVAIVSQTVTKHFLDRLLNLWSSYSRSEAITPPERLRVTLSSCSAQRVHF
ncbi:hypothetical protein [Aquibium oceanicum]|uniref:hypothetical protein n=1 Tax=Aquibium oceanicum TaxID=1670800 RepID=UPI001F24ADF5|nr:hypothetical protein [Aquibium oceanicum]